MKECGLLLDGGRREGIETEDVASWRPVQLGGRESDST